MRGDSKKRGADFFETLENLIGARRGWWSRFPAGMALLRYCRPWDLRTPLPLAPPLTFREELVRYGQGAEVYRHLLFHAGCQMLGPLGRLASWAADYLDRRQAARGRRESITEVVNNIAGREMGRRLIRGLSGRRSWAEIRPSLEGVVEDRRPRARGSESSPGRTG